MKILIIVLFFCSSALSAMACKCKIVSVKDAFKTSQIIVSITVLEMLPPIEKSDTIRSNDGKVYVRTPVFGYSKRVLIKNYYKGKTLSDTVIIAENNSNCELPLEVGKSYLIYGSVVDNKIYTSRCTRSGLLEHHADLNFLEKKRRRMTKKQN